MDIKSLMEYCIIHAKQIKKQHNIIKDFHLKRPWVLEARLKKVKMLSNKDISFESAIEFKENYLITDLTKIYKQIVNINPEFLLDKPTYVAYYKLDEGLYKKQTGSGLQLGDEDENGKLVTGSDLIVEVIEVDIDNFLNLYYSTNN